jgi:hypothetical protein
MQSAKPSNVVKAIASPSANSIGSNPSDVRSPVISPTNQSVQSTKPSIVVNAVGSPNNDRYTAAVDAGTVGSPTNFFMSAPENYKPVSEQEKSGSFANHPVNNASPLSSPVVSPSNQSVAKLSTITNSANAPSNYSVNNASVVASQNSINASIAQSFGRKSSMASSNSEAPSTDELSEYRSKLFAKMLHLLDDVENPGLHASSTKGSNRSYEYSVAELKLIQKRTEEEMSRILNDFDRSKHSKMYTYKEEADESKNNHAVTMIKKSQDEHDHDLFSQSSGPPTGNVLMPEALLTSKLSDITSPTTYQDGSGVFYLDSSSNNYINVIDNEDELIQEGSPRNLPPRPSSPRKKRTPVFGAEDSLPIVQETAVVAVAGHANLPLHSPMASGNAPDDECTSGQNRELRSEAPSSAGGASDGSTLFTNNVSTTSPKNQAVGKLLELSRNAARRTVRKERKQAEDRFHHEIFQAVSDAEEAQRLHDEVQAFVATFDSDIEDPTFVMNEDGSLNEHAALALSAMAGTPSTREANELNVPSHKQCGVCVIQ